MADQTHKRTKKIYKNIKINIKRRTIIVDDKLVFYKKIPMPSWIELSIIDVCNRSCSFCPKSNHDIAPDTFQRMKMPLINKLTKDLKKIGFKGSVTLCGYGEPLLHKEIYKISKKLAEASFVEIVTNGDVLKKEMIKKLYDSNVNKLLISLYDGPDQVEKFKKMTKDSGVPSNFVILRDRWHDEKKDFGLKLTNRAGTIDVGIQDKIDNFTYCYYPSYSVMIDWDGNFYLCPQDWHRKISMGNLMQSSFFEIWTDSMITKYRKNLILGKRCDNPCNKCNAEGTVLGEKHAKAWKSIYKL